MLKPLALASPGCKRPLRRIRLGLLEGILIGLTQGVPVPLPTPAALPVDDAIAGPLPDPHAGRMGAGLGISPAVLPDALAPDGLA